MKSVSALLIILLLQVLQAHTRNDDILEVKAHQNQHFTLSMLRARRGVFNILPNKHVNDKEQRRCKTSLSSMEIVKKTFLSQLVQRIKSRTKLMGRIKSVVKNYFGKSVKHMERNENQKRENNLKKSNRRVEKKKMDGLHKFCRHRYGKVCQMIPKHTI